MDDAYQFALSVPATYVLTAATPFASYVNAVTAFGLVCLLIGVPLASYRGNAQALSFLVPFLLTEVMAVWVVLFAATVAAQTMMWIILVCAIGHFMLVLYLMGPIDEMRAEIMMLGFHSIAYAGIAVWLSVEHVSRR